MAGMRAGLVELALQVGERDIEIDHGHSGRGVAEQFHQDREIEAAVKHFAGIGVAELMGDDAGGNAGGGRSFVQIGAQLAKQHLAGSRPRQQMAIRRRRIERTEEAQTVDQITREGVDGHQTLALQFAQGDLNGPMARAGAVKAVEGKINGFADAHAGVTEQEEEVGAEIVAAAQFLLQQAVVPGRQGARQAVWTARNILAAKQLG